jgi:hypothetical protein
MSEDHAATARQFAHTAPKEILARVGWDPRCERTLESVSGFARGLRALEERHRRKAAASFGRGFLRGTTANLMAKNAVGLASAMTGIDFISLARRLTPDGRARARR